ncbi:MAG: hypothetical protein EXR76_18780 [Myxococcales bacterium]|nr:hypothetical protein [Myxococcales bacterium]
MFAKLIAGSTLAACSSGPIRGPVVVAGPGADAPSGTVAGRRTLPDTTDGIYVFYDQLQVGLTDSQVAFVAAPAAGSQKLNFTVSERIRALAPNFVVLQHRLAFGLSSGANLVGPDH